MVERLLPVMDDPETGGFFAAATEHRLVVQACAACGSLQQPPRPRCRTCLGQDLGWRDLPQRGRVHTWTVVEHQINPHFPAPYTVVLVDVDPADDDAPAIRFVGHLPGRPEVAVGTPVRVVFEELPGGIVLPNWELATA
ncbi:OB-fold domain-containing protein [Nocardioides sp. AE5]|uniref:Zn-ribbon domain-containing OB-fold protein n=1 Tax=Nocardioides sp. AE5 TaxID=2962573 RepID=UPI00288119A1|nr:OB-fold domain-containing protein [Nocardioides sp. AE5]MDT0202687.1 OB-fold domain-containing protein [Nocardioides sp. AE5]